MKALTIIQPWASLIALGEKKIETRSWRINYRGPILIHAGKKIDSAIAKTHPFVDVLNKHEIIRIQDMPIGSIIARCNLVDCLRITHEDGIESQLENDFIVRDNEYCFGDYSTGRFAWILDNIEPLKEPIQAKGHLSLWEFDCKGSGVNE